MPLGANRYQVGGSLNIKGVAKPVTVNVTISRQDDGTLVFNGAAEVRMRDYGLNPQSAALGLIGTNDEMTVAFPCERQEPSNSALIARRGHRLRLPRLRPCILVQIPGR